MDNRKPLMAANWKMYKTGDEARQTARDLVEQTGGKIPDDREVLLAPPFTAILPVCEAVAGSGIRVGGQNVHWETEGAFTGEISPLMLRAAGCEYVIIGHSERRHLFAETDETINKKLAAAIAAGLKPILCLGETEAEREAEKTFSVLDKQIQNGLQQLPLASLADLVLAYEPVWAIGTGKTATREQAQEAHAHIRSVLADLYDPDFADGRRILYGGSVKPGNVNDLMAMADIDGALVGGASLAAETFAQIINFKTG